MAAPKTLEPRTARIRLVSEPEHHRPLRRHLHPHDFGEELGAVPRRVAAIVAVALLVAIAITVF